LWHSTKTTPFSKKSLLLFVEPLIRIRKDAKQRSMLFFPMFYNSFCKKRQIYLMVTSARVVVFDKKARIAHTFYITACPRILLRKFLPQSWKVPIQSENGSLFAFVGYRKCAGKFYRLYSRKVDMQSVIIIKKKSSLLFARCLRKILWKICHNISILSLFHFFRVPNHTYIHIFSATETCDFSKWPNILILVHEYVT